MSIRSVFFDLDGVLVDACEWHYQALNRALQEVLGIEISRQDHESTFNGLPTKRKLHLLREQNKIIIEPHVAELIEAKKQVYTLYLIREFAKPDNVKVELLSRLRGLGLKIACVTNSIEQTATTMLECTGQWPYINYLVHNRSVLHPKPHAEPYVKAMVMLQSLPEETVIVEDSAVGLESAKAAAGLIWRVNDSSEVTWEQFSERYYGKQFVQNT